MNLTSRVIVIAGTTTPIGLAAAEHLYPRDASLALVDRDERCLIAAARALSRDSERLHALRADCAPEDGRKRVLDVVDRADHLVVASAEDEPLDLEDLSEEVAVSTYRSRALAPLFLARALRPRMRSGGSITLLSGEASVRPTAQGVLPATMAGALDAMSRALVLALAPLRVNVVSPGSITAPSSSHAQGDAHLTERFETAHEKLPVRLPGKPSEVAQAIASAIDNHFMTGNVLHDNGGGRLT